MGRKQIWHCKLNTPLSEMCEECAERKRRYKRCKEDKYMKDPKYRAAKISTAIRWQAENPDRTREIKRATEARRRQRERIAAERRREIAKKAAEARWGKKEA